MQSCCERVRRLGSPDGHVSPGAKIRSGYGDVGGVSGRPMATEPEISPGYEDCSVGGTAVLRDNRAVMSVRWAVRSGGLA